jgi:CheY-like chemotaxis protein
VPRILVADDNSNIQKMVALAFEEHGIDVIAVGNGEAAVRRLPDVNPDVILADVFMPVRNGYEVCEYVKKDPRFSQTPVILLVGAFDPLDEVEARRVGADGVLKKPFVPPDPLISMVMGIIAKLQKPEPKAEAAPEVAEPPRVVPAIAPVSVSSTAPHENDEDTYAFGTGRRSLDDDEPADLAAQKAAPAEARSKVVVAVETRENAEEEDASFSETHADWRRRSDVDSASVPDFSAELVADPTPPAVEEPPAPPPTPEREVGPIEFLDATETAHGEAEFETAHEQEPAPAAVEYFEPPQDNRPWPPSSLKDRAIDALASDVLVVEHDAIVEAGETAPVALTSASSIVEVAPADRSETQAAQRDETPVERGHVSPLDAAAAEPPNEWSRPPEVEAASAAALKSISDYRAELHSESHAEARASVESPSEDVVSANAGVSGGAGVAESSPAESNFTASEAAAKAHPVAAQVSAETHGNSGNPIAPEANASAAASPAQGNEAAARSAVFVTKASAFSAAAGSIRIPEDARVAAEEESAIRAEAEGVASWEAASSASTESRAASGEARGEAAPAQAAVADESATAQGEATAAPVQGAAAEIYAAANGGVVPSSGADAASIAAEAVLASLAGGEALVPNRAASTSASPSVAQPPAAAPLHQPSVDEVVAKVLERLGPQLQEILANGLVRPLVEGLLSQQKPPEKKD